MGKCFASAVAVASVLFFLAPPGASAQQASVKIVAPTDGASLGANVEVKWEFKKAGNADHVLLYLDGSNQGPQFGTSTALKGLSSGPHTVRVIAATKSHQTIGPEASVTFVVAAASEKPKAAPTPPRGSRY